MAAAPRWYSGIQLLKLWSDKNEHPRKYHVGDIRPFVIGGGRNGSDKHRAGHTGRAACAGDVPDRGPGGSG